MVVGGGPVGSALALLLDRAGVPVVLLDAGASSEKICGEGILPAGWRVLCQLGLDQNLPSRAPIEGLVYNMGGTVSLSARLQREAFGVPRPDLVRTFSEALSASSVDLRRQTRFRSWSRSGEGLEISYCDQENRAHHLRCQFLVGADGLHSTVRRKSGLQSESPAAYRRWGTRCYFRSSQERSSVEVTLGKGVESYLTPLGQGLYGLAFLWSPHLLGRPLPGEGPVFERLLAFLPSDLLTKLPPPEGEFWGGDRAIGPLQQKVSSVLHPSAPIALAGDAAGYFDALTGEGLCLGLQQAEALAACLVKGRPADYPALHRAIKFRHGLLVGGLLFLIHRPRLRERVFHALAGAPAQFEALIRFGVEEASWFSLLSQDVLKFLWGVLRGNTQ